MAEYPINNQPIQNSAYNYYNNAPNNEQFSKYIDLKWQLQDFQVFVFFLCLADSNYNVQYTTSSTTNYQQSDNNGFQEQLYIDDAKDLHFSSHHGSHSTEFSSSHSHGSSGGSGGQSR